MMKPSVSSKSGRIITICAIATLVILYLIISSNTPYDLVNSSAIQRATGSKTAVASANDSADSFECTKAYDGVSPVNQYVIMIDAGSSGSRVHVYHFNNCQASPRLVHEEFKMLEPGLSSYKSDPEAAAKSLDPLLEVALDTVPKDSQKCTPIAVKATAGLRLIGEEKSAAILEAVRTHLEADYPFAVVSKENNGVAMLSGADEGAYAWVTVNYLLGNIVPGKSSTSRPPTAAVFDLGGGSTQIVFEPTFAEPHLKVPEGDHKYDLQFGNNHYTLYQHSHLGYGLNVARETMYASIVKTYLKAGSSVSTTPLVNPCLPPGGKLSGVKVTVDEKEYSVDFVGPKEPSMMQCQKIAEIMLNKEAECKVEPCSFNGIHQPSLVDSFLTESDLYVISYFYDRTFPLGMPSSFNIDDLKDLGKKVCTGKDSYDSFRAIDGAVKELEDNPQWCGDLSYMLAILHTGYDIPVSREVRIAKKIKNNELGWCLGASLPLLDKTTSGWTCKLTRD